MMGFEKRTRLVENTVEVVVCDGGCDKETDEAHANGVGPDAWLRVVNFFSKHDYYFCSWACLADWAKRQAEKAAYQTA